MFFLDRYFPSRTSSGTVIELTGLAGATSAAATAAATGLPSFYARLAILPGLAVGRYMALLPAPMTLGLRDEILPRTEPTLLVGAVARGLVPVGLDLMPFGLNLMLFDGGLSRVARVS